MCSSVGERFLRLDVVQEGMHEHCTQQDGGFTATDDAGNSSTASQTITVQDTTAPEFTFVPADESTECTEAWSTDMATASDNCGTVTVTVEETTSDELCGGLLLITRTFTATDDAGNSTTAVQTITQIDTTAPALSVSDVTIECSEEVPAPSFEANDACSGVEVTVSSEVIAGDCAQESTIVRTYTAVDGCGNTTTAVQNVYIVDTTAPEFIVTEPASITLYEAEGDDIPEPSATVADACDANATWTVEETVLVDLPNDYTIQRVYTASDDCGNEATFTSTITFVPIVEGCTDEDACNYNEYANIDDENCFFALPGYDCDGNCLADVNDNGICDGLEVAGCTDPTNPGYNPAANVDDGSCLVGGCVNTSACNYNADADYQVPGSCEFVSCAGCLNVNACNYDSEATLSNGSCVFAQYGYNCDGECLLDDDGDGICNQFEVAGCTDPTNPAYNPNATDDNGSCLQGGCTFFYACNFDPDADFLNIFACDFTTCAGCMDEDACNFDPTATLNTPTICDFPESSFVDCDGVCFNDTDLDGICDEQEIPGCTDPAASNYSPFATDDNGSCIVEAGGCTLPFACNYDPSADYYLPGSCDFSCLNGMPSNESACTDELACNFGADEPCSYFDAEGQLCATIGCTNEAACNFDPDAQINSGCDFSSCLVFGCTNDNACNFNPEATTNDMTCDFTSCNGFGCTDENACNYDADALINDGSCVQVVDGFDCDGNCMVDADADGVCDMNEVGGCTDLGANYYDSNATDNDGSCIYEGCTSNCACNYDPVASVDDGSCEYDCLEGCVYETALNYDASASIDDGSCQFQGCMDASYSNYNPIATVQTEGDCSNEPASADLSPDGEVQLEDLLNFLQAFGLAGAEVNDLAWANGCYVEPTSDEDLLATVLGCEGEDCCTVGGCSYPSALNYNPDALIDHGVCLFPGCTDSTAFNYDALANVDDNSCVYNACPDFNGDGLIQVIDLMDLLLVWGTTY